MCVDTDSSAIHGFIVYKTAYNGLANTIWVEALYTVPQMRYNGITRALLSSFPGARACRFTLHKSRSEAASNPMMQGILNAKKIEDVSPKFELWEVRLDSERVPGSNPAMDEIRRKIA